MNLKVFLLKKGLNPGLKGFGYIEKAIQMIIDENLYSTSLRKSLYPKLSENLGTTEGALNRAITYCIQDAKIESSIIEVLNTYAIEFGCKGDE